MKSNSRKQNTGCAWVGGGPLCSVQLRALARVTLLLSLFNIRQFHATASERTWIRTPSTAPTPSPPQKIMASPNPILSTTTLFRRLTWQSAVTISIRLADGEPGAGNACDRYYVSYSIPDVG